MYVKQRCRGGGRVVNKPAAACFQHTFHKHLGEKCHFSKQPLVTEGRFLPASCSPVEVNVDGGGVRVTEGDYQGDKKSVAQEEFQQV